METNSLELLMPAGSYQKLEYAYAYGADAAYVGVPFFSLRARENEFDLEGLKKARALADKHNKKLFVTANIFARNRKLKPFVTHLDEWASIKPDAFIISDPGLMMIVREKCPEIDIHLSVQANCMNWQAVKFWHEVMGVKRIILSRELSVGEIKEIKQRVPTVELEAFVHGSICIAYSGRCLMSSYFSYRDANNGVCDNSCREKFNVFETKASEDNDYYIEDLRNKGEFYKINEDENGTFIMNAKDLRMIQHLRAMKDAGICSFKVEGRTKSVYYVSMVARAYRKAIDDLVSGQEFNPELIGELDKVANRGYHTGFFFNNERGVKGQNFDTSVARNFSQKFAGLIKKSDEGTPEGFVPVEVRNKLEKGQVCEVLGPDQSNFEFTINEVLSPKGERVETVHGGTGMYYFKLPKAALPLSVLSVKQPSQPKV